ncbi:MAG: AI-2E family transporter [Sulfurimicrobium sp.]|jgi:predicted PurR-regulated permease PerM|nr:AI-2E family transporter [Sulfurimicrobium sp.]MDZ7655355.1 AI-2E family transporter [Sulfurimicrobium sp.]
MALAKELNPGHVEIATWLIAAILLIFIVYSHLLPALLAGLLMYELVHLLAARINLRRFGGRPAKIVAVVLLSSLMATLITLATIGLMAFFHSDTGKLPALMQKMAVIIEGSRTLLPEWLVEKLPTSAEGIQSAAVELLRTHASEVQTAGKEMGRTLVHVLIGLIIGAMISLREVTAQHRYGPLSGAMAERVRLLGDAFRRIVFAQVRIAALNALFTAIYLVVVLPLFGVNLPLVKTLIIITFLAGLLPVVGNLISNSVIVIVSLGQSLQVAIASLLFLIVIHKLEYFLNARIIGTQIRSQAWELLLAMLAMEAAFGLMGVVAAPIYYAYLKSELVKKNLI